MLAKKPKVTTAEAAAVELDGEDEQLIQQMEDEAEERGAAFDSDEEREKLKVLKAEQAKQRMTKLKTMQTGGLLRKMKS